MRVEREKNEVITGKLNANNAGLIEEFRIVTPEYFNNWILIRKIEFNIWDAMKSN